MKKLIALSAAFLISALLLAGCISAATQYGKNEPSTLSDEQLIAELASGHSAR